MLKRYDLKSSRETHEGWAIIVIDTANGYFSTVSDYGNYSYIWSSPGLEFRKFLCGLEVDYLRSKLLHGRADKLRVFDDNATALAIRAAIEEMPSGDSREGEVEMLDRRLPMDERGYEAWQYETLLPEAWAFGVWSPDPQCTAFCEKVWPRFKKLLEDELEKEEKLKGEGDAIKQIFASAGIDEKLRLMDDSQIADIVMNHVWSEVGLFSTEGSLLETVIERLRRADRGLLPSPALCAFCKKKPVAYGGAVYCGAGCTARAEAHEKPSTDVSQEKK